MPQERERTALKEKSLYEYSVKKKMYSKNLNDAVVQSRTWLLVVGCWFFFSKVKRVKKKEKKKRNCKKKKRKKSKGKEREEAKH